MQKEVARNLIYQAVQAGECWADLGAGSGTFSYCLAELLGPEGQIFAIDRSPGFASISAQLDRAPISVISRDFTQNLQLPPLDGILMANSLHYVAQQEKFLNQILTHLKEEGKFLLIEYDRRIPNPWVPFPISRRKSQRLFRSLSLYAEEIGSTPSQYGNGDIYAILGRRLGN